MRLILVTQDFPPDVGGTQTYSFELANWMSRWCEDFVVIAPDVPRCNTVDAGLPYDVIRVPCSSNQLGLQAGKLLIQLAKERGFESVFHVQWSTLFASIYARTRSPIKFIYCASHGRELLLRPLPMFNTFYDSLRKKLLQKVDLHFPVSHYTGSLLSELGVSEASIKVVPNGVNLKRFRPIEVDQKKVELGLTGKKVMLTVCRLVERKGIEVVLRALADIAKRIPEIIYLIAGSGPYRDRLQSLAAQLGVQKYVSFMGYVPDDMLNEVYNLCDVFVMPSHHSPPEVEGFGLVFLEAGAAGKPSIGTLAGGIPDAIQEGKTGLLIMPNDERGLAAEVTRLLTHEALTQQLGHNALVHVNNYGGWEQRVSEIYNWLLQSRSISDWEASIDALRIKKRLQLVR